MAEPHLAQFRARLKRRSATPFHWRICHPHHARGRGSELLYEWWVEFLYLRASAGAELTITATAMAARASFFISGGYPVPFQGWVFYQHETAMETLTEEQLFVDFASSWFPCVNLKSLLATLDTCAALGVRR